MVRGEIYYHLLPGDGNLDSLAEVAFTRAAELDPGFSPPLTHLADLMFRRGDLSHATLIIKRLERIGADSALVVPLLLMRDCIQTGPGSAIWDRAAGSTPDAVLMAAQGLAAGGSHLQCAESGFRSVLDHADASPAYQWGALIGLTAILAASGRDAELVRMVDSAQSSIPAARMFYLVDDVAGGSLMAPAESAAATMLSAPARLGASRLWYLGQWSAHRGDTLRLRWVLDSAKAIAARSRAPSDSLLVRALTAHLVLLGGDSAAALKLFANLRSVVPLDTLVWGAWDALAPERVQLAELLLASGHPARAAEVAAVLDGSQSLSFLTFLPRAIEVRRRAAEQLGNAARAAALRRRLAGFGTADARRIPNGTATH